MYKENGDPYTTLCMDTKQFLWLRQRSVGPPAFQAKSRERGGNEGGMEHGDAGRERQASEGAAWASSLAL